MADFSDLAAKFRFGDGKDIDTLVSEFKMMLEAKPDANVIISVLDPNEDEGDQAVYVQGSILGMLITAQVVASTASGQLMKHWMPGMAASGGTDYMRALHYMAQLQGVIAQLEMLTSTKSREISLTERAEDYKPANGKYDA